MKLIFLDVETTGTDYKTSAIHQISGKVIIDGKEEESFDFKLKPFDGAEIDNKALSICGVTIEQINEYPRHEIVYMEFVRILNSYINKFDKNDKFHIVGYNCQAFDSCFIREFFIRNKDWYYGSYFYSATLDVMILAAAHLANVRHTMIDFKQSTVAKKLGIDIEDDKLHDATYDIDVCHKIYNKLYNKS